MKFAVFAAGLLALSSLAAAAAPLTSTETQTFSLAASAVPALFHGNASADTVSPLHFAQFDGALGTLTDVTLSFSSTGSGASTMQIYNGGGQFSTYSSGTFSLNSALFGAAPIVIGSAGAGDTLMCPGACLHGEFVTPTYSLAVDGSYNALQTAAFVGNGQVDIDQTLRIELNGSLNYPPYAYLSAIGAWNGSATLTYGYVTTAVPEPESYAMLLAGLGLVGAVARRRRRA